MTVYTPSPPLRPTHSSSPPPHTGHLSTKHKHQQEPVILTARKVDLELLRLKGLGKVTKKSDAEDQIEPILTTDTLLHSVPTDNGEEDDETGKCELNQHGSKEANQLQQLEKYRHQLETSQRQLKNHQQEVDTLKEELNTQYQQQLRQQEQQLQHEMVKYQTQLVQQEKMTHDTISNCMEKVESSQVKVRKLTILVEKQDQLIELLVEQQERRQQYDKHTQKQPPPGNDMTADRHPLHLEKHQLETAILSLKANMETNQAHMQMMMMVSTEIQNDFERQKAILEQQLTEMADELAAKDILLRHYQGQKQRQQPHEQKITTHNSVPNNTLRLVSSPPTPPTSTKSSASLRPIVNEAVISTPDISRYPSLVSSSSSSRSSASSRPSLSYSTSPSPPPLHLSTSSSIASAPSSPPPTIPLPPIPPQLSPSPALISTTKTSSNQQQQLQYSHYQDKQQQHDPSPMLSLDTIGFGGAVKKGTPIPSTSRTGSLDENHHHGKPFWKSMKTKWRHS